MLTLSQRSDSKASELIQSYRQRLISEIDSLVDTVIANATDGRLRVDRDVAGAPRGRCRIGCREDEPEPVWRR